MGDDVPNHHDVIASVNQLLNVDPEIPKLLDELLVPEAIPHVLASAIDGSIGELCDLVPLDIGIKSLHGGVEVVAVESRVGPAHDLHVLLRHRLLPQPGGFEGFVTGPILAAPHDLPVSDRVEAA